MNDTLNGLPQFSTIKTEEIEKTLDEILTANKKILSQLENTDSPTWQNLIVPMEEIDDKLHRYWSLVSHMNNVVNTPALRDAYNNCLPKLTQYSTDVSQNRKLYDAYLAISKSTEYQKFDSGQKSLIDHALRDFKLSGVHLNDYDKKLFSDLRQELSKLTTKFENNVMDATDAWTKHILDEKELLGLPDIALKTAKNEANKRNLEGWVLTLESPCYSAVITYADSATLREEMYRAYTTRASELGPNAGKWNNHELMYSILKARKQLAQLLGYKNYAESSLVTKMAENTTEVMSFLEVLVEKSYPRAVNEYVNLCRFALEKFNHDNLNAWDVPYFSEKLSLQDYQISQEQLRPYFPEDQVLSGLFEVIKRLYGITFKENKHFDTWHEQVRMFDLYDETNELRGHCYIDLYARPNKRGGAWMDDCRGRRKVGDQIQLPIAFLTCNFNAPVDDTPALFTHDEVLTLFHECGHGLHHLLTKINYAGVSGINGVPWDAVELPSQFFENWCWNEEVIDLLSKHYKTGEKLPKELFDKMIAAKNFHSALAMIRQLEFALFDFRLHMEFNEEEFHQLTKILHEVREDICVIPVPDFNRFPNTFSHIFAGGYAAGYYSYKWAEVLSADAFSKFEENGIFDQKTGREFLHTILEKGGSEDPKKLFAEFRGREPKVDALLRHSGII